MNDQAISTLLRSIHQDRTRLADSRELRDRVRAIPATRRQGRRWFPSALNGIVHSSIGVNGFAVAGVIVALVGGFLLYAAPFERLAGTVPGAGAPIGGDIVFVQAAYGFTDGPVGPVLSIAGTPRILTVPSDGGTPASLVDVPGEHWTTVGLAGPVVAWSPDGSRIAFRLFNDVPGIYLMERDGSGLRRLVDLPEDRDTTTPYAAALDWSPDGTRIAYPYPYGDAAGRGPVAAPLYVVDVDDGEVTNLTGDDPERWVTRTVAWSPDGSMIAYARTRPAEGAVRLYVMAGDGTGERELPTGPESNPRVLGLAWSPDSSSIAFLAALGEEQSVVRVVDADGSDLRTLSGPSPREGGCCTGLGSSDTQLAWSPDGSTIAMYRWVGEDFDAHQAIVLMDADGTHERELMAGQWFDWSPDGSQLVVASGASADRPPSGESYVIHIIDADGTDPRMLVEGEFPAWAPDGADQRP